MAPLFEHSRFDDETAKVALKPDSPNRAENIPRQFVVFPPMKKTLVLGATPNPGRYAYLAMHALVRHGHEAIPVGIRAGEVAGLPILIGQPEVADVDTVTLYVGPQRQPQYYDYLLALQPKRIIFNPGTENDELVDLAEAQGIETVQGCTLVMLSIGGY